MRCGIVIRGALLTLLCVGAVPLQSRADLAVTYAAVEAELVLFNQPQKAPFEDVGFKIFVKGARVRTETVDHRGRTSWQLVDRSSGTAYVLDPVARTYQDMDDGAWNCDNLADQIGRWIGYWIRLSGADTLVMKSPVRSLVGAVAVEECEFIFQGKILGSPVAVDAELTLSMLVDETSVVGESGQADLYCGEKPTQARWAAAYKRAMPIGQTEATELASVTGLPLQVELNTDLGLGRAHLVIRATDISKDALDDSLFEIPSGFTSKN